MEGHDRQLRPYGLPLLTPFVSENANLVREVPNFGDIKGAVNIAIHDSLRTDELSNNTFRSWSHSQCISGPTTDVVLRG